MKGKTAPLSSKMKAVGRNMARADQQKSSKKVPMKFAAGGMVKISDDMKVGLPTKTDVGSMDGLGDNSATGFGAGKSRGSGAATKGTKFSGSW